MCLQMVIHSRLLSINVMLLCMNIVKHYLRLLVFLGVALIGVQVPSFVHLYGAQLQAHLNESTLSLKNFQADADKYFEGNLTALVKYYQAKTDPIISNSGNNIDVLVHRNNQLKAAVNAFNSGELSRYLHVFNDPLADIQQSTWAHYDYRIRLSPDNILWALSTGIIGCLLLDCLLSLLRVLLSFTFKRNTKQSKNTPN